MSHLVGSVVGELGTRGTLLGLLPASVFASVVGGLLAAGAPARAPEVSVLLSKASELSAAEAGVVAVGLVVASLVTAPLQLPLVRLFEGYGVPGPVARAGRKRQGKRRSTLTELKENPTGRDAREVEAAWVLAHRFPPAPLLLPTSLGNALRAAEYRAGKPYGLDAVIVWPHLYVLLGDKVRAIVDDRRLSLDVAVRFTATFLALAIISLGLLATHGWWLAVPLACLVLARVSYLGAVSAAIGYGEGIDTAVDLHHFDLRTALGLWRPTTTAEERAANRELMALLKRFDYGASISYQTAGSAAPAAPADPKGSHRSPKESESGGP